MQLWRGVGKGRGGAALALLALGLALGLWLGRGEGPAPAPPLPPDLEEEPPFHLEPSRADELGIEPDSHFLLTARLPLSRREVQEGLRVSPPLELEVRPAGAGRFLLLPKAPLAADTVYRFTLAWGEELGVAPHSWAFQVKGAFRVVGSLPRHQATNVPTDSGIEITFSHEEFADPAPYFSIDPPTEGRFERHKRTLVFVPTALQPQTVYTVRLAKGLPLTVGEAALAEDYVFQFETRPEPRAFPPPFFFPKEMYEAPPGEAPALAVFSYRPQEVLSVQVFRFPGREEFLASLAQRDRLPTWATSSRLSYRQDTAGLVPVASFEVPVTDPTDPYPSVDAYIRFPVPLPTGYYLVEARSGETVRQTWLQVSRASAFLTGSRTRSLLWANDAVSGQPLAGARLELVGAGPLATTDHQGTAMFDTPALLTRRDGLRRYFLLTAADGSELVLPAGSAYDFFQPCWACDFWPDFYRPQGELYWHYLYTDRLLYQPTDSLRFWGIARQRETGHPPLRLTVELVREVCHQAPPYGCQQVVAARTEVSPSDWGTYQGELAFTALTPGDYRLRVRAGEVELEQVWGVRVTNYVKPAYRLLVEPAFQATFAGEPVEARLAAQFWEGTPLPDLPLRYGLGVPILDAVTDQNGEARVSFAAPADSADISHPRGYELTVAPANAEEGDIAGRGVLLVFPARVHLQVRGEYADGRVTLRVETRHVDLSRLEGSGDSPLLGYLPPERYLGAPATGQAVTGTVTRVSWQPVRIGESYDFIAKRVVPLYRYEQVREQVATLELVTDQDGRALYSFPALPQSSYVVALSTRDAQGRAWQVSTWLYTERFSYYGERGVYSLQDLKRVQKEPSGDPFADFAYAWEYRRPGSLVTYRLGEEVALAFTRDGQVLPQGEGRFLFLQAQLGLLDYRVQEGPLYRFPFQRRHVPNVMVQGVYFNGRTYVVTSYRIVRYEQEEARLQVSVSPDRPFYRPGEEVTLSVQVRDGQGRPVVAEVNLSLVDEALFRLQEEGYYWPISADPLPTLYRGVGTGVLFVYPSHQVPQPLLLPGGRGGGGDGAAREDFRDRAFFGQVRTDASGRGQVTFRLPDNLTSWRITYQAVTPDLQAGSGSLQLTVTLPLFVDVTLNQVYLEGDQPVLRLRAFGRALSAGQAVTFRVEAPSLGLQAQALSGRAFQPVELPLPPLPLGQHRLVVSVEAGGIRDAIVRTFRVTSGHLLRPELRALPLTPGQVVVAEEGGRTTLLLLDRGRGALYPLLLSLRWSWGDRADQVLARWQAAQLLRQHFGEEHPPPEFQPATYQAPDGGIALLPYSSSDLALSAKAAALGAPFDRAALRLYFQRLLDDPKEGRQRATQALLGLAALGEPVLARVQALLRQPDLTPMEGLYLGLAAYLLGDHPSARDACRRLLALYGESKEPYLRLRLSDDQDEVLEATALGAALAAGLGLPQGEGLLRYSAETRGKDVLVELEKALALTWALARASAAPARIAFELGGQRQEAELPKGQPLRLELAPGQWLRVLAVQGEVEALASRLVPASAQELALDPELRVRRSYWVGGRPTTEFREGQLVQVVIEFHLPPLPLPGCYQVTDYLPAGLRPLLRYPSGPGGPLPRPPWFPLRAEGQEVTFCVWQQMAQPIVYYARVVNRGQFQASPPLIRSLVSEASVNVGQGGLVSIR